MVSSVLNVEMAALLMSQLDKNFERILIEANLDFDSMLMKVD